MRIRGLTSGMTQNYGGWSDVPGALPSVESWSDGQIFVDPSPEPPESRSQGHRVVLSRQGFAKDCRTCVAHSSERVSCVGPMLVFIPRYVD